MACQSVIVSDRYLRFTSRFPQQLLNTCRVPSESSTSKHHQTDGSTKIMNCMDVNFLRCYCTYHQTDWADLPSAAEYAYYSETIDSMGISPLEADPG